MSAARLYVRRPSGAVEIFHATVCTVDRGVVIATGVWKYREYHPAAEYVWPSSRVLEIRREVAC